MNTTNLISTPQITGNIGSCTTKVERVYSYNGYVNSTGYNLSTNSCSGVVEKTDFTEVSLTGISLTFIFGFIALLICLGWVFRD